jgi:hypothetical protein
MRKLSLENPQMMDLLNHQVIHMDQGITYTPEYIATREMCYYPSRTAQMIRSVYTGELEVSDYSADVVFSSILSGQGERWQNFGESPNSYILTIMLGRELFYQRGMKKEAVDSLKERVEKQGGYIKKEEKEIVQWKEELPIDVDSKTALLLDEATFSYAKKQRRKIGSFLKKKQIEISDFGPYFTGFDYLAAGLIDEAITTVKKLIESWEEKGIDTVITMTGQSQYLFTILLPYLEIDTEIEFISVLDLADSMNVENAYIYGGSYFTRYLRKENVLNQLLANTKETKILNAPEFLPELEGDKRRNVVGIWIPPIAAEYHPTGIPDGMEEKIYRNSLDTITKTSFGKLIVCDPFAYKALKEHGDLEGKVIYFTDVLE